MVPNDSGFSDSTNWMLIVIPAVSNLSLTKLIQLASIFINSSLASIEVVCNHPSILFFSMNSGSINSRIIPSFHKANNSGIF
jgi:hypothetical protein